MFRVEQHADDGAHCCRYRLFDGSGPLRHAATLQLWQHNAAFRSWFAATLGASRYGAFRWECPPMSLGTTDRHFEFVLIDSPDLDTDPEPQVFAEHFKTGTGDIVCFDNLGKDALLIVPSPREATRNYAHLAAFLRNAPASQIDALWQSIGQATAQRLDDRPLWLSTAGGGVAWLHVRLDTHPKYYAHAPYRQFEPP